VLRRLPGDMADETFLSSERVIPKKAVDAGFKFAYPDIFEALKAEMGIQIS
jgi:NAD dependent epimerase/dehydratase family enzyme